MNVYNPTRMHLLARFASLRRMVRGSGHFLFDEQGTRYLDFLSQYGVVSFGHNHPELLAAMQESLAAGQPSMIQPFPAPAAQELAEKLKDVTPGDLSYTVFTNSGAEAVEAAIKLARAGTGRKTILATFGSFHGKTLGALSATGNPAYQAPFGAPAPHFEHVPFGDLNALEAKLTCDGEQIAAFLVEPVQGEGGMIPAPPGYLAGVVQMCRRAGVLTIFDEVQTGLGRTGALFAATAADAAPDVLLLGKALGGGLMPIGACVCAPHAWDHTFGMLHSSTFAGNQLACAVGSKVIDLLLRDHGKLIRTVAESGRYLLEGLGGLAERYPSVIQEVRGRGLMAGVEFRRFSGDDSYTMGFASRNGLLTALLSGYLLNTNRIVTAPVFNDAHFLRLEPPFTVGRAETDEVVGALADVCRIIDRKEYSHLFRYLAGVGDLPRPAGYYSPAVPVRRRRAGRRTGKRRGSFAFLIHYATEEDYLRADPSFRQFTPGELDRWRRWTVEIGPGVVDHVEDIGSVAGTGAEGWLLAVPMAPRELLEMRPPEVQSLFRRVIGLARDSGAEILGLGGFTSVVTRGGRRVVGQGMPITTGNCLSAVMAVESIRQAVADRGGALRDLHVAVVGAAGAIGRLSSLMLADEAARITLVGNGLHPDGQQRCRAVAGEIYRRALRQPVGTRAAPVGSADRSAPAIGAVVEAAMRRSGLDQPTRELPNSTEGLVGLTARVERAFDGAGAEPPLRYGCHLGSFLKDADVVLVATSSDQPLVCADHLKEGAIVCDVARPSNVAPDLPRRRPDVMVFEGGLVELPAPVQFGPGLPGLPSNVMLGCLAETALLAAEGDYSDHSIGRQLSLREAAHIRRLAEEHGYRPAAPAQCRRL